MATYNSAGSGNFNADATWTESGQPSTDDVAVIASGHTVTMTADASVGSIDIQGTLTTDGTARTLTLDDGGQGYICEHRGTVSTTINLTINSNFAGDRLIRLNNGGNGNFNNVSITLQSTSRKLTIGTEAASIGGNLTIAQGEFNTDSSNNYALTVTGATTIGDGSSSADTATLTCNASTISLGSGVTGAHSLVIQAGGTFVGGTGTHTLGSLNIKNSTAAKCTLTSGNTTINGEHGSSSKAINIEGSNGTTNFAHGSGTLIITFNGSSDIKADGVTLNLNNLTINHADADINTKSNLTCAGDVTITAGILDGEDDAISFGSLEIQSGGTYNATSGTTIIKGALRNVGGTIS